MRASPKSSIMEPIAIVSMACRLPGGVGSPEEFWRLLKSGRDGVTEISPHRLPLASFYDADKSKPGRYYTQAMGVLADSEVENFDAALFSISPREAKSLDPQQRLLMKVMWEALENAGYSSDRRDADRTGVFVGISGANYRDMQCRDVENINAYTNSGTSLSMASGRLSYFFGLQGPSMTIDTACSSTLVATHYAMLSLLSGESRMALVGGVCLNLAADWTIGFSKAQMLSPDGRCKTFDSSANGYVRSEGCVVMALKLLSEAVADGDKIHAVLRGSAVNNDGRSAGLTVPDENAQVRLIQRALSVSGIGAGRVSYVEAHGTGTPVGDPIEVRALGSVYGSSRLLGESFLLGSVKSNIGHLEPVSGLAGLMKTVLALKYEEIPANLHFKQINPKIDLDGARAKIVSQATKWPRGAAPRIAGVNSFSFSGTNAHLIVEEAPQGPTLPGREKTVYPLTISAQTNASLKNLARRYSEYLAQDKGNLSDFCHTVNRRARLPLAIGFAVFNRQEAIQKLNEVAELGEQMISKRPVQATTDICFLMSDLTGLRLGKTLFADNITFKSEVEGFNREWMRAGKEDLLSHFLVNSGDLGHNASAVQFCFNVAYAKSLMSWGVQPKYFAGQRGGDIAAAYLSGDLSVEKTIAVLSGNAAFAPSEGMSAQYIPFSSLNKIGAKGTVLHFGFESIPGLASVQMMKPALDDWKAVTAPLIDVYNSGVYIDWQAFDSGFGFCLEAIPNYAFDESRYWLDGVADAPSRVLKEEDQTHPFLRGLSQISMGMNEIDLDLKANAFIMDHRFDRRPLFPAVGYMEMMYATARKMDPIRQWSLRDVMFLAPLFFENNQANVRIGIKIEPLEGGEFQIAIHTLKEGRWGLLSSARLVATSKVPQPKFSPQNLKTGTPGSSADFYSVASSRNFDFGPCFKGVQEVWRHSKNIGVARINLESMNTKGFFAHPGYFDASIHNSFHIVPSAGTQNGIPFCIDEVTIYQKMGGEQFGVAEYLGESGDGSYSVNNEIFNSSGELIAEVKGFHMKPFKGAQETPIAQDVFCGVKWVKCPLPPPSGWDPTRAHFLVFADRSGVASLVIKELEKRGSSYTIARSGKSFGKTAQGFLVSSDRRNDYDRLFTEVLGGASGKSIRILDFRAIDLLGLEEEAVGRLSEDLNRVSCGTLFSLQAAIEKGRAGEIHWTVFSRGAQAANTDRVCVAQAPMLGFARTASLEHPELQTTMIDLDPTELVLDAAYLLDLLPRVAEEREVALRGNVAWAARVDGRIDLPTRPMRFISDGTYLITGGLGGLGLMVAEWMALNGAKNIVVTGRREPDADVQGALDRIRGLGTKVMFEQADLSELNQVKNLAIKIAKGGVPLKGIMHAAGVARNVPVFSATAEDFSMSYAAKVVGTLNLIDAIKLDGLDFLVLFSSQVSVLGNQGQCAYGAANSFLDSIAHQCRGQGLPVVSINWGPWATDRGMSGDAKIQDWLVRNGTLPLPAEQCLEALGTVLASKLQTAQISICKMDWPKWFKRHALSKVQNFVGDATGQQVELPLQAEAEGEPATLQIITNRQPTVDTGTALPAKRPEVLRKVQLMVAKVMGFAGAEAIDPERPLASIGLDSLMFVELRTVLGKEFGAMIPTSQMFDYPTAMKIADFYSGPSVERRSETAPIVGTKLESAVASPAPGSPVSSVDLLGTIQGVVAKIMGYPDAKAVDATKPLASMGLDSLMFVELRNHLGKAFGSTIPTSQMFDYPTVEKLVQFYAKAPAANNHETVSTDLRPKVDHARPVESSRPTKANMQVKIQQLVAKIMGFSNPDSLDVEKPLASMGLDSLMFVELRTLLSREFGKSIPTSKMFDYPTIEKLSEFYIEAGREDKRVA